MLLQRILTVVLAAPFLIGIIICPATAVFKVFTLVCLFFALWEYFGIVGHPRGDRFFASLLGSLYSLCLLFAPSEITAWLPGLVVISSFAFFCFHSHPEMSLIGTRVAHTSFGIFYIGSLGSFVGLLRDLPEGRSWVLILLAMTWLNDTCAYFAGHKFGRRRMAPKISPGKTWEGFAGGMGGSFLGFLLFSRFMNHPPSIFQGLLLTLLVGTLGPLGDLSESLIKRSFGVKDSGNIIPGHGGMLDRIDALLFTAPVVFAAASFF